MIPGSGKYPGEENGNPLQYSGLENPMDRGASWATLHRVTQIQTRLKQLSKHSTKCRIKKLGQIHKLILGQGILGGQRPVTHIPFALTLKVQAGGKNWAASHHEGAHSRISITQDLYPIQNTFTLSSKCTCIKLYKLIPKCSSAEGWSSDNRIHSLSVSSSLV